MLITMVDRVFNLTFEATTFKLVVCDTLLPWPFLFCFLVIANLQCDSLSYCISPLKPKRYIYIYSDSLFPVYLSPLLRNLNCFFLVVLLPSLPSGASYTSIVKPSARTTTFTKHTGSYKLKNSCKA